MHCMGPICRQGESLQASVDLQVLSGEVLEGSHGQDTHPCGRLRSLIGVFFSPLGSLERLLFLHFLNILDTSFRH
jgi:hypothetical protein